MSITNLINNLLNKTLISSLPVVEYTEDADYLLNDTQFLNTMKKYSIAIRLAVENDFYLYRGTSKPNKNIPIIEIRPRFRNTTRKTSQYSQSMIDIMNHLPFFRNWPKRDRSIIFTNNKKHTEIFGTASIVLPSNDALIAIHDDDFNFNNVLKVNVETLNIFFSAVYLILVSLLNKSEISNDITNIFKNYLTMLNKENKKFDDFVWLYNEANRIILEYSSVLKIKNVVEAIKIDKNLLDNDDSSIAFHLHSIENYIKILNENLTPEQNLVNCLSFNLDKEYKLLHMSPKFDVDIEDIDYKDYKENSLPHEILELWTESDCLLIFCGHFISKYGPSFLEKILKKIS